jgi:hypothetical protein
MHNEPVAWINRKGEFMPEKVDSFDIPLYTHPLKELTDAEIWSISANHGDLSWQDCTLDFARAILRKAQEK